MSTTSRCSSIRSITGCGRAAGRTRVELAPARPSTLRANSMIMHLQAEAQAEARDVVLAGVAGGGDLALDAAHAEPAGDHDAVEVAQAAVGEQALDVLGLDPVDLDLGAVVEAAVLERLDHRQVGVGQVDVLADEADAHRRRSAASTRSTSASPLGEVGLVLGRGAASGTRSRRGPRRGARAGSRRGCRRRPR